MDAHAKLLLLAGLVTLSLSTWAQDIEPLTDEENEALAFTLERANTAVDALGDSVKACGNKGRPGKRLDRVLFKGISLTDQEWTDALATLHYRTLDRCMNKDGARYRALATLMQLKITEKHYAGKNTTKTVHSLDTICCDRGPLGPLSEMRYSKLDQKVRQRLEAIPGINEPFDLLNTLYGLLAAYQSPVGKTDEETETLAFSLKKAITAMGALDVVIGECDKPIRGKVLDPALLKVFTLTDDEWKSALSTLHYRALNHCINKDGVHHRALVARMQFKNNEKSITGKNATKIPYTPELICCDMGSSGSRHEMRYSKLDQKVRQRLEAIPGINEPFDFIRTLEALGAINNQPAGKK